MTEAPTVERSPAALRLGVLFVLAALARVGPDLHRAIDWRLASQERLEGEFLATSWNDFGGILLAIGPIAVGIALILTRDRRFARAASLTAGGLAVEGTLSLIFAAVIDSGWGRIAPAPGSPMTWPGPMLPKGPALAGWIALVVTWWVLMIASRRLRDRGRGGTAPRLASFAAGLFALVLLGTFGWSSYLEVLERFPSIRRMVLLADRRPARPRRGPLTLSAEEKRAKEALGLFQEGRGHLDSGRSAEARRAMIKSLNRYEALVRDFPQSKGYRREVAHVANNLAWFLVTSADPSARDPETAVAVARRAVELEPDEGNYQNTLAVALLRTGDLDGAEAAFRKAMDLRDGGDSFDWYFLAQIEARRGRPDAAKALYARARAWHRENPQRNEELDRFRAETAKALGLDPAP